MFAQDDVTISVNMNYGKWIEWNGNGTFPFARSWYSTTTPKISVCCTTGGNNTTDIRGNKFKGANNMSAYGDDMLNLMFFSNLSTYQIMVEEGYYIKSVDFDFDVTAWTSAKSFYDFPEGSGLSVTPENGDAVVSTNPNDVQHISWTNEDDDYSIYTFTYSVNRVGGDNGFARTSNYIVTVATVPDEVLALQELENIASEYGAYESLFVAGTKPGQYSADAIQTFTDALELANNATGPDSDNYTAEQLRMLGQHIKDAYEAVLASRVPMTLADGYYRIKSAMAFYQTEVNSGTGLEETNYYDKYISTSNNGETISAVWNTPDDLKTHAPSLWKVTNKNGLYDIVSTATDARFANTGSITLTLDSDSLMAIDPETTDEDDITYVNIRFASAAAGNYKSGYNYFHTSGHSSGKGTSGNITKWKNTYRGDNGEEDPEPRGSEWVFVPVDDATAAAIMKAYEPIKEREMMLYDYQKVLEEAKKNLEMAKDMQRIELIKNVSQITFVKTDPSEGSEAAILDNDASTFWHSDWHSKDSYGRPSLTIELAEPVQNFTWSIQRRASANDHVTKGIVYAGNNAESLTPVIEELEIGNASNNAKFETEIDLGAPYKFVKFEFTAANVNTRGVTVEGEDLCYAHFAEFHMILIEPNEHAQIRFMGDLGNNLEKVLEELAELELEDVTKDDYNKLKSAYEAFMSKFVDPTALREVLAAKKDVADAVKVGTDPGFWSAETDAAAYKTLYEAAVAYDASGDYTPAQSESYIEQLNSKADEIFAAANKVRTDKWYRIRFAPEEDFDTYGWDKVAGNGTTKKLENETEIEVNESLFGKYVTVSWLEDNDEQNIVASGVTTAEVGLDSKLFFDAEEDIDGSNDLDKFRFIAVGDTAYIIQNKGTGLYIKAGTTGATILSAHPSLFNTQAIGLGLNLISAKSLKGENQNYLHAQVDGNNLVTWNATTLGSRSALYIKEAGDVASNYVAPNANFPIVFNTVNTYCYPVDITPVSDEGQMWTVSSVDPENNKITLGKIEKADGGRPFIYIFADDLEQFDETLDAEMVPFKLGTEVKATEAQCHEPLKGTFSTMKLDRGEIYAKDNKLAVNSVGKDDIMVKYVYVYANQAYISNEPGFNPAADLEIIYSEDEDGIQTALANVAKSGKVYTIDGRLVSKKANLNNLSGFGKGIYILNGTKVVVK